MHRLLRSGLAATLLTLLPLSSVHAQDCDKEFDNTFDLIQEAIFEAKGCTASFCHDQAAAGGLDLRAEVAYDNLIDQPSQTVPEGTIPIARSSRHRRPRRRARRHRRRPARTQTY